MFEPAQKPRLFGLPPGVDFPNALVSGLRARLSDRPPEAMARVDVIVNTRRMARRLREIFDAGPASFLPRVRTLGDLDRLLPGTPLPPAVSPLRRRLDLVKLVSRLLDIDKSIAPRTSLYALADSLAALIDEMQGEGVAAEAVAQLDVSDQSGHWARAQQFLNIAQSYLAQLDAAPDAEARQRQLVLKILAQWALEPPIHPIIVAGSTGSRGTTALLMQAVARLPQGALILPGFDFASPSAMWSALDTQPPSEDHPQYRFYKLMKALELNEGDVYPWTTAPPASTTRNELIALSLRPAPVTDTWLSEGPKLIDVGEACAKLTLLEAQSPRQEALAIAARLRKAVAQGTRAALITPDRMLTRQVTAALDRWNILPDDSAGTPLHLSPPGRFLRHVAELFVKKLDALMLLTLLKHPLCHSGPRRNEHQLFTQQLEMEIRRVGLPYPDAPSLLRVAQSASAKMHDPETFLAWADWVSRSFCGLHEVGAQPLPHWVAAHQSAAEQISAGRFDEEEHALWKKQAGQSARQVMETLCAEAPFGGSLSAADYGQMIYALLSAEEVRDRDAPHPNIMIWGTLEARVQGADLVILGGLNEGSWPEAPPPDPWLNRQMRLQAGLLLPERRIGLSAHDYQQAVAAREVWLSRSIRSEDAETVPSRWLNRLGNLLNGLPDGIGAAAWQDMRARGSYWLGQAAQLEATVRVTPAPRPSPRPPLAARPQALSVTEIQRLIRDPYAIYAKHVLRLRPINALVQEPDAPMRGVLLHRIMERFVKALQHDPTALSRQRLLEIAEDVLSEEAPWPAARLMWRARIARIADWFVEREGRRQQTATPLLFERAAKGILTFDDLGVTITGYADRIDWMPEGKVLLYDYKTGTPPTKKEQTFFDKQLLIEAAMIAEGSFADLGPSEVAEAIYIGLGPTPVEVAAPLTEEPPVKVIEGLHALIAAYRDPAQGFTSRRMVQREGFAGDYDQLARFGEWDATAKPSGEDLE
ncbi:MAG: double-strand break repair protein AddB [Pseudomonadota bacterium]